jgi:hypothetical protein
MKLPDILRTLVAIVFERPRIGAWSLVRVARRSWEHARALDRALDQAIVDDWNARHPIGTRVAFRFAAAEEGQTITRSAAYLSPGFDHTPMVEIEGQAGGWYLSHLRVIGPPSGRDPG